MEEGRNLHGKIQNLPFWVGRNMAFVVLFLCLGMCFIFVYAFCRLPCKHFGRHLCTSLCACAFCDIFVVDICAAYSDFCMPTLLCHLLPFAACCMLLHGYTHAFALCCTFHEHFTFSTYTLSEAGRGRRTGSGLTRDRNLA